jgi:putative phosphoribosyl transferase
MGSRSPFRDRTDAGRRLADRLAVLPEGRYVVYALPRGGVPIGWEIAQRLNAPLDIVFAKKIPAPGHPELAIGAVALSRRVFIDVDPVLSRRWGADTSYVEAAAGRIREELRRRMEMYGGGNVRSDGAGCTAILADDGIATGATIRAGAHLLREMGAAAVIIAVPVAPDSARLSLMEVADTFISLIEDRNFRSVSDYYEDFPQLNDADVMAYLRNREPASRHEGG